MIPVALNLASRIVSGPRAQKVMAWFFVLAAIAIMVLIVVILIRSGNDAAVKDDRKSSAIDAITIQREADNAGAWFQQGAELDRQRGYDNAMETINASITDPDGDPLRATLDGMR